MRPDINPHALERRIRHIVRGPEHEWRIICHPGLETLVAEEISASADPIHSLRVSKGALDFRTDLENCWKIHASCRTPSRMLLRIAQFRVTRFPELVRKVNDLPWECYLFPQSALHCRVSVRHSRLLHTEAIAERILFAIKKHLEPWSALPTPQHPGSQTIFAHLEHDMCTLSLDASGELLYRRGYDKFTEEAPLRDTMAAAILLWSGWMSHDILIDPMAGSGTFSWEALLMRTREGFPAFCRSFAFMQWPAFRKTSWEHLHRSLPTPPPFQKIYASDTNDQSVTTLERNRDTLLRHLNLDPVLFPIEIRRRDFFRTPVSLGLPAEKTLITLNPPYGVRLSGGQVSQFARIGQTLKKYYSGCTYAVVCPGEAHVRALDLPHARSLTTRNGGLSVHIVSGQVPIL